MYGMTTAICGYCGRPVIGFCVYDGGRKYHPECTHGPDYTKHNFQTPTLSAEQVRQIVREELSRVPPA